MQHVTYRNGRNKHVKFQPVKMNNLTIRATITAMLNVCQVIRLQIQIESTIGLLISNFHIVCKNSSGWQGDLCDVPICRKGCDPMHGYCKKPNECRCNLGNFMQFSVENDLDVICSFWIFLFKVFMERNATDASRCRDASTDTVMYRLNACVIRDTTDCSAQIVCKLELKNGQLH